MIRTVESINEAAQSPDKFIKECTEEYLSEISSVAQKISENKEVRIIAMAGPSAAGKTTTAKILKAELEKRGESVVTVSLDDFYKEPDDLPVLPDGTKDIESVNSLDKKLMRECYVNIAKNGEGYLPRFDFESRKRIEKDRFIKMNKNDIFIVEGLHALNPEITGLVPNQYVYKIFICLDRSVEDNDGKQFLSARQIRFVRRVVRDIKFRASDIKVTLNRWNNVLEGETKFLFPFKDTADFKIRTMQPFEICVYKEEFCRLRAGVDRNTPWYEFFTDTVNAMEQFASIDASYVPTDSLIREFIG